MTERNAAHSQSAEALSYAPANPDVPAVDAVMRRVSAVIAAPTDQIADPDALANRIIDSIRELQSLDNAPDAAYLISLLEPKLHKLRKSQREFMGKSKEQGDIVETADKVLFWSGWPSQWYSSEFASGSTVASHESQSAKYSCAEQYMMAEKARLFDDANTLAAILATSSPKKQKELGRQVKGFVPAQWDAICREVVYRGNLAKFSQNERLKELLLATGDKMIVEASPYDRIWGIGRSPEDPLALNEKTWDGKNWLGLAIMKVRKTLTSGK